MLCTPAPAPAPATVPAITNVVLSAEERAAEIDRLRDWAMNDDAESLNHIVAGLTSPEKEIREAAIEATKQFGSTNAISALKAAAAARRTLKTRSPVWRPPIFFHCPAWRSRRQPWSKQPNCEPRWRPAGRRKVNRTLPARIHKPRLGKIRRRHPIIIEAVKFPF
jgi:hypothetical protein